MKTFRNEKTKATATLTKSSIRFVPKPWEISISKDSLKDCFSRNRWDFDFYKEEEAMQFLADKGFN